MATAAEPFSTAHTDAQLTAALSATSATEILRRIRARRICSPICASILLVFGNNITAFLPMMFINIYSFHQNVNKYKHNKE
jgi:hypothetical protein